MRRGIYVASRATPDRIAMWRKMRALGAEICSSWIDDPRPDMSRRWIINIVEASEAEILVLYAEPEDFPLKGAFVEVGAALGAGVLVNCFFPGVNIDPETCRPVGSWIKHPLVRLSSSLIDAVGLEECGSGEIRPRRS